MAQTNSVVMMLTTSVAVPGIMTMAMLVTMSFRLGCSTVRAYAEIVGTADGMTIAANYSPAYSVLTIHQRWQRV